MKNYLIIENSPTLASVQVVEAESILDLYRVYGAPRVVSMHLLPSVVTTDKEAKLKESTEVELVLYKAGESEKSVKISELKPFSLEQYRSLINGD